MILLCMYNMFNHVFKLRSCLESFFLYIYIYYMIAKMIFPKQHGYIFDGQDHEKTTISYDHLHERTQSRSFVELQVPAPPDSGGIPTLSVSNHPEKININKEDHSLKTYVYVYMYVCMHGCKILYESIWIIKGLILNYSYTIRSPREVANYVNMRRCDVI